MCQCILLKCRQGWHSSASFYCCERVCGASGVFDNSTLPVCQISYVLNVFRLDQQFNLMRELMVALTRWGTLDVLHKSRWLWCVFVFQCMWPCIHMYFTCSGKLAHDTKAAWNLISNLCCLWFHRLLNFNHLALDSKPLKAMTRECAYRFKCHVLAANCSDFFFAQYNQQN